MKVKITIQNIVASVKIKQEINLKAIVKYFPQTEYRPEQFPGLVFRTEKPKSAILIFSSGKMVCTGTKSMKDTHRAIIKATKELKEAGILSPENDPEITIQNIVASVILNGDNLLIDLDRGHYALYERGVASIMYEPEQFPGLIYRMKEPTAVLLIFTSGKLVCVGTKKREDLRRAVEKITVKLQEKGLIVPHQSSF